MKNKTEIHENLLNADSFGRFCPETFEIKLNFSKAELEEIESYQKHLIKSKGKEEPSATPAQGKALYQKFTQAFNHELMHLYQVMALPTFQLICGHYNNWFKIENIILLQAMDAKFIIQTNHKLEVLSIVDNEEIVSDTHAENIHEKVQYYQEVYKAERSGINIFHLIEGMAHAASVQLQDNPEVDTLGLWENPTYSKAFAFFEKSIQSEISETRWKLLLFIYICYFALHSKPEEHHAAGNPVIVFQNLCSRAANYMAALGRLSDIYSSAPMSSNRSVLLQAFNESELQHASLEQLANMRAFYEIIEIIQDECVRWGLQFGSFEVEGLEVLQQTAAKCQAEVSNLHFLYRIMVVPANYAAMHEIYYEIFDHKEAASQFSFSDQSKFYEFMRNFRNVARRRQVDCCEQHGTVDMELAIRCGEPDSFAHSCKEMFQRPAWEIFR